MLINARKRGFNLTKKRLNLTNELNDKETETGGSSSTTNN